MYRQLVAYSNHKGVVCACICVTVLRSRIVLRSRSARVVLIILIVLVLIERSKHVVFLHQSHKAVVHIEVKGEVMPLITHAKNKACIEATQMLIRGTVVFVAGHESVIVVGALRHTWCHLTVPQLTPKTHIERWA